MQQRRTRFRVSRRGPCEGALARLRTLSDNALQSRELRVRDVQAATEDLVLLKKELATSAWVNVGPEQLPGLVALLSLALRLSTPSLSPRQQEEASALYAALRHELVTQLGGKDGGFILSNDAPDEVKQALVRALLRTHAFRCYSAHLSDAGTLLRQRPSQRNAFKAQQIIHEVVVVLGVALNGPLTIRSKSLTGEIAAELVDSGLLEHWAHVMMILSSCQSGGTELTNALAAMGTLLHMACPSGSEVLRSGLDLLDSSPCLSYMLAAHTVCLAAAMDGGPTYGMPTAEESEGSTASAPALMAPPPLYTGAKWELLHERAPLGAAVGTSLAQWVMSLWAAAITQARDQLQQDMRDGAVTAAAVCTGWGWRQERWRLQVRPVPQNAGAPGAAAALPPPPPPEPLRRWVGCAAAPPLHTRAAFEVSLRLVAAAVEQMERRQQEEGQGRRRAAAAAGAGRGGSRVQVTGAASLAARALECAQAACEDVAVLPSVPGWVQHRLERYRLLLLAAVACAREYAPVGDTKTADKLLALLACLHAPDQALQALPPAPTPDVAAALSAGHLGAVERLLRVRREEEEAASVLLDAVAVAWPHSSSAFAQSAAAWAQMLAYGPRAAVFSLLATVAKRVRRAHEALDNECVLLADGGRAVELLAIAVPLRWLRRLVAGQGPGQSMVSQQAPGVAAVFSAGSATTAAAAASAAGGYPQLRLALTFIATRIVPTLLQTLPRLVISDSAACSSMLPELLDWLPLLAAIARHRPDYAAEQPAFACGASGLVAAALAEAVSGSNTKQRRSLAACTRAALCAMQQLAPPAVLAEVLARAEKAGAGILGLTGLTDRMAAAGLPTRDGRGTAAAPPATSLLERLMGLIAPGGSPGASMPSGSSRGATGSAASASPGAQSRPSVAAGGAAKPYNQAATAPNSGAGRPPGPTLLRRVLGPGGAAPDPELLAALEGAAAAGDSGGGADAADGRTSAAPGDAGQRLAPSEDVRSWLAVAALLAAPAELEAPLPPACGNPSCMNLAADSEADLPLRFACRACRGGCQLAYCSAQCRDEHAAADHARRN